MKKLLKGRSVKAIALVLTLALILPLLPALPSFAASSEVTSITFEGVNQNGVDYANIWDEYVG